MGCMLGCLLMILVISLLVLLARLIFIIINVCLLVEAAQPPAHTSAVVYPVV